MNMYGNVNNPMPMGPVSQQQQAQPVTPKVDPQVMKQMMYDQMVADAEKYATSDPNAMICPSCGGSGIKTGKQPK